MSEDRIQDRVPLHEMFDKEDPATDPLCLGYLKVLEPIVGQSVRE